MHAVDWVLVFFIIFVSVGPIMAALMLKSMCDKGMAVKKPAVALLGVASAVLVVAGLVVAGCAFVPYEGTKTRLLPKEPDVLSPLNPTHEVGFWVFLKISMWVGGEFSGIFIARSPLGVSENSLGWQVISQWSYDQFLQGRPIGTSLYCRFGVNETASHVLLPTSGNYYLVLFNDQPIPNEIMVTIHFEVDGLNLKFFVPGLLLLAASLVLFIQYKRKKERVLMRSPIPHVLRVPN